MNKDIKELVENYYNKLYEDNNDPTNNILDVFINKLIKIFLKQKICDISVEIKPNKIFKNALSIIKSLTIGYIVLYYTSYILNKHNDIHIVKKNGRCDLYCRYNNILYNIEIKATSSNIIFVTDSLKNNKNNIIFIIYTYNIQNDKICITNIKLINGNDISDEDFKSYKTNSYKVDISNINIILLK